MLSFLKALFTPAPPVPSSIYDFRIPALNGDVIDFSAFRGKKIMIVNTASLCGHTPQYAELEELSQRFKDKLVVVGFPCNNFLFQEPGTAKMISDVCHIKYKVTFPMSAKVSVKGPLTAPIYRWLTNSRYNKLGDSVVKWNFQKYLINEEGRLICVFTPAASPLAPEVINAVEG